MVAVEPGFTNSRSFSKMSVITQTWPISAMRYISVPSSNRWVGEMLRDSTKPETGE